jgi:hypothetical protein
VWYGFDMGFLNSGNEKEVKLLRLDPIKISIGTSRSANAESALFILY